MTHDEQLAHERLIAEILAVRNPKNVRSRLDTWLGSSVVAALVGVLGTGVLGAWLSARIQDRSKNNELQRSSQQQRLAERNAAVVRILGLTATYSGAIDDLFTIVNNAYADNRFKGQDLKELTAWKKKIRNAHDEADSTWRRDKITAGYTLLYAFDNNAVVAAAWLGLSTAGDGFETCANEWYRLSAEVGTESTPEQICEPERKRLADALTRFTAAASAERVKAPA